VHVPCFGSVLHGEIYGNFTWVQNFKFTHTITYLSKCAAGPSGRYRFFENEIPGKRWKLQHILKRHPLITFIFSCHPILKARAFK